MDNRAAAALRLQNNVKIAIGLSIVAFLATGTLLLTFAHGKIPMQIRKSEQMITIAVPFADDISKFDTAKITKDYEYMMLQALYSTLLEHDYKTSQIVTGLAESFRWEISNFIVVLKKNIRTKNGYEITADDVIFTINRQMTLNSNTHGDLRRLLCEANAEKDDTGGCTGVKKIDRYTVSFELKQKNADIVRSLTSIDFGIIPIPAVDQKSLKIVDYSETSGPLFFSGLDSNKRIILQRQLQHWHRLAFDKVTVFSDKYIEENGTAQPASLKNFESGEIDIIPTCSLYSLAPETYGFKFPYNAHITNPIGLTYLHLTTRGQARSQMLRQKWSVLIQEHLAKHSSRLLARRKLTNQFFMEEGFGALDQKSLELINSARAKVVEEEAPEDIVISVHEGVFAIYQKFFNDLLFVKIVKQGMDQSDQDVDARATIIDSSFDEDINYLEYLYKEHFFPLNDIESKNWLKIYSEESDDSNRNKMVQDLHMKMLFFNPTVIPLFSRPYTAIGRNGWSFRLPKNYVNTPFWLIRKE